MADNEADCRENAAVKKAPRNVVNDLFDSNDRLMTSCHLQQERIQRVGRGEGNKYFVQE
jgi:hypothetical protein